MLWILSIAIVAVLFLSSFWFTRRFVARSLAEYPPVGKFVTVCDSQVHYIEEGSGQPVIMIHGSDGTLFNFKRSIFESVAAKYRAIAFDRPGHGYSEAPPAESLTIPLNAQMIREATRQLGIEKPIVLGYSYGGAVALRWAIDHPEDIAGLVLISPAVFPHHRSLILFAYIAGIPLLGPLLVNTLFVPLAMPQIRFWAGRAFQPDPLPEGVLETVKAYSLRPKQFAAFASEMRHFYVGLAEISRECGSIRKPVAILAGEEDRLVSPDGNAMKLHTLLPQSTLCIFPATGHEVHHKYTAETLAAIDRVACATKDDNSRLSKENM